MLLSRQSILSCIAEDELHLILLSTEACNFRCTYCYEDFQNARMAPWVVQGVKRLVSRQASNLRKLRISWFGGEPTLTMGIIEEVMSHIQRTIQRQPGIQLFCDTTTNAYLLDRSRFEAMLGLGVTVYQVAFDGPPEVHDRMRVLAGGAGTFARIWTNVCAMQKTQETFTVVIRLHVDPENMNAVPKFIDKCAAVFAGDRRFKLFIRKRSRLGGANSSCLPVFAEAESMEVSEMLSRRAKALGLQAITAEERQRACYAASGNSFVVRADGRLNKCTVALEHPNNQVGRILEDGTIVVDEAKMRQWMRGLWARSEEQLRCPMVGYAEPAR